MEQETNYGEQSTSGKKRKMPVIIGSASAMVVIAILCVAVISGNLNKKDTNNNIDEHVQNIINEITKSPDYVSSIASLGIYDDFNDDGVKELLLTYKTNLPSARYRVTYHLECAVNIDTGNGVFIWGDQKISREEYEAKKNEMSWIYKLTPDVGPDPGNSVSFDELLTVNDR